MKTVLYYSSKSSEQRRFCIYTTVFSMQMIINKIWVAVTFFKIVEYDEHGCLWTIFPFLCLHFCTVNVCADHSIYSLYTLECTQYSMYVSTLASRIHSGIDHIFTSPWLELKWQLHFVIFSVHICVHRINWLCNPCAMPQFLVVRTRLSCADSNPPVF